MSTQRYPRRFAPVALGGAAGLALVATAVLAIVGHGPGTASGAGAPGGTLAAGTQPAPLSAKPAAGSRSVAARGLVADPEAAQSFPQPAGAPLHAVAITPGQAALTTAVSPGAPSDAQVRAELRQMAAAQKAADAAAQPGTIGAAGTVTPPRDGPAEIARVIAGANAIASFPYVFGGGHGSFVDTAYDCSGSLSYALAAAGMLNSPVTSGELMSWGVPGPGRYLTVFANPGHTFMYVDGLRYDTSGRDGVFGTRWQTAPRTLNGFVERHWPGL